MPRQLIVILSACNFVIGMSAFVVIGMVEPVRADLLVSASGAAGILTVYALAYAVMSPLLVTATGSVGRRRVLLGGLGLFAAGNLAAALSDLTGLYAARVLSAAGAGLVTPVTAAVAAALSPPETRGRALAAVFAGLTLAQVAGVPVGSWIAYTFGWRSAFWLVVVLCLPCLWLVRTRVPRGLSLPPVALSNLGAVMRDGVLMAAVLFTASFLGAIYVLFTYISPLLTAAMGYERDGITLVLLVFGVGAVAGNLIGGWLTDRIGAARTLVFLCLCQIGLMPIFSGLPVGDAALFLLVFAWSVAGWSFMAAQQLRLISLDPSRATVLLALNAAAIYVGAAAGSAAGGLVFAADPGWLGAAAGIAGLGALGHLLWSERLGNLRRAQPQRQSAGTKR